VSQVLFEVVGEKGKLMVLEDSEIGHVFAVIPYGKKASPALIHALREQTLDPWRYVEGVGFVLDITAWKKRGRAIFGRYKEQDGEVQIVYRSDLSTT
jgi:hypothetical protein